MCVRVKAVDAKRLSDLRKAKLMKEGLMEGDA